MSVFALDGEGTDIEAGAITDEPWWRSTLARPPTNARATHTAITKTKTAARGTALHETVLALGTPLK